ncbi:hypothetical protein J7T55_002191 [Diaporthe amygdali]|uniref:uncharacterized protein n=1 Tax=Phomopsis amygdali TaxID=1214568 RepID=UPI0022FE7595|nr:uncharacterized protein J7T55_002191 [Diaporthe amygdali]KAJ0103772.1 hypothetical protein J7T55_002191 [Diaporthe amygdali]
MDSPSIPDTNDIKAALESIVGKGTRLESFLSDFITALQELAPKETTVYTKPQKDPQALIAEAHHRAKTIIEQIVVLESELEAAKCLGSLRKPDALMRSDLCRPRKRSHTAAPGRGEAPYPRERSQTPCSDSYDTYESAAQLCSKKKRRGSSILVNTTFGETSDRIFIYGRHSIFNQFPGVAVDTQSELFAAPRLSIDQEEQSMVISAGLNDRF